MDKNWNETVAAAGAVFEDGRLAHFGNPDAETLAARDGTVISPLAHLGVIRVGGEEARSFLHNQLTSDVNHLTEGVVQHSAWCSAKGRMVASFVGWRAGEDYLLLLSADLVEAVAKRLQMFVLRAKVTISVPAVEELALIGLAGSEAAALLERSGLPVPDAMKSLPCRGGTVLRLDAGRFILAQPAVDAAAIWNMLGATARPVGPATWRWLDIRAGLPMVTAATREQFVPQMANFERIGGVSFHKGCYPGQEIVARTQYLGKVKRHLYRLSGNAPMVAGTELHSPAVPDQACGMIVTGAASPAGGFDALAVLMETAVEAGIRLGTDDGPTVTATPVAA